MGWFGKKDREESNVVRGGLLPSLPKLPELPELSRSRPMDEKHDEQIHQLPSFPTTSLGEKFSRDTIKQAVSGPPRSEIGFQKSPWGRESEMVFEADDFVPSDKGKMMPKPERNMVPREPPPRKREIIPPIRNETRFMEQDEIRPEPRFEIHDSEYHESEMSAPKLKKIEPVFIRIDKFENSLKTFEKVKKQISDIEKTLKDVEKVKEEEHTQLETWKSEVMKIKEQIQKVDNDIFSSLE